MNDVNNTSASMDDPGDQAPPTSRSHELSSQGIIPKLPRDVEGMTRWLCNATYEIKTQLGGMQAELEKKLLETRTESHDRIEEWSSNYIRSTHLISKTLDNTIAAVRAMGIETRRSLDELSTRLDKLEGRPAKSRARPKRPAAKGKLRLIPGR